MSEKIEKNVCTLPVLPSELTFKGIRKIVMENVWVEADEAEQKGIPLTDRDFSEMLSKEWVRMKKDVIPQRIQEYQEATKTYEQCLADDGDSVDRETIASKIALEEKPELAELGVQVEEEETE